MLLKPSAIDRALSLDLLLMLKGRCQAAMKLIKKRHWRTLEITLNQIAKECFLSHSAVKAMARKYRQEQA